MACSAIDLRKLRLLGALSCAALALLTRCMPFGEDDDTASSAAQGKGGKPSFDAPPEAPPAGGSDAGKGKGKDAGGDADAALGGAAGLGGTGGAGAGSGGTGADASDASDAEYDGPLSVYCGDGIRDVVAEECDDGAGTGEDACTDQCRVHNYFVVPAVTLEAGPKLGSRSLGYGRHPVAAGATGSALAFVEKTGSSHALLVALFDLLGHRQGAPLAAGAGASPAEQAEPVLAALPGGAFALAWNDLAGGSLDVRMRLVQPGGSLGATALANQSVSGAQQDADLLWDGTELVAAWVDSLQPKIRRFNPSLAAIDDEALLDSGGSFGAGVSLARFSSSWAAAWRAIQPSGQEVIRVRAGSTNWSVGPFVPGAPKERPALVELDATHLLVAFTESTDPLATGTASVTRLRVAVLDVAAAGSVASTSVPLTVEPWKSDSSLSQSRPALVRAGSRWYLGWQSESPVGDARDDEVWLRELSWNGAGLNLLGEIPLQSDAPRTAAQRAPALAVSPLGPAGAVVTAWEDATIDPMHAVLPDLVFGLRPTPIVTLPPLDGGGA